MKKMITAIALVLALAPSAVYADTATDFLQEKRILVGDENGDLNLEDNLTRAEAITLAMRSLGFDDSKWYRSDIEKFSDMPLSHWAAGYVYKAVSENIIDGYDGKFMPYENLTAEQWCKILVELSGYSDLAYPDGYVQKALELGILNDDMPQSGEITRGTAAKMLYNALTAEGADILPTEEPVDTSPELPEPESEVRYESLSEGGGSGGGVTSSASVGGSVSGPVIAPMPEVPGFTTDQMPEPVAGQITAGEWNDNINYDYWQELMTDQELYGYVSKWSFNKNRFTVTVTDNGNPVRDALVSVSDTSDNVLWRAVTDRDGTAYVFIEPTDGQQQGYIITAQSGEDVYSEGYMPDPEVPFQIELAQNEPEDIVDVMFTIDTTGSMGDELQYIKSELKDVISKVDSNVRISCNYYRDYGDAYVVKPYDFTTEIDNVMDQITNQYAMGGGDYPEAVDEALYNAVSEHDWSPSARARLLFLVLDAPPHYDEDKVNSIKETVKTAAEKGIRIIPVASSGVDKETEMLLRSIALETAGRYVFLTDDSGIGLGHMEADVGDFEVEYLNEMILRIINEYM